MIFPALVWSRSVGENAGSENTSSTPALESQGPNPAPEHQGDMATNIPYYTLRDGMSSMLTVDNNSPTQTKATITLFNPQGRAQVLDPITLDPHSVNQFELRDLIPSDLFDEGSLTLAYYGTEMGVTCQVSIYSLEKRVSFESREQGMMDFQTSAANGILWLPQKGAQGFLAITNISRNKITVSLSAGGKTKNIDLYSRETHVVNFEEEFRLTPPTASLVKLSQSGLPGDIITTGFVMDLDHAYSAAFTMFDPKNPRSSVLAGAHFRFGTADPREGFPRGTTYVSPLFLANVSAKPVKAHLSVDYTKREKLEMTPIDPHKSATEDTFSTIDLRDVTIAPGELHRIELAQELAKLGVTTPVSEAGVEVTFDAPPGSLIAHLVSMDEAGGFAFEVPMKDPLAWNAMTEGINPWTLEDGTRSVLHLKNTTGDAVQAWATLDFPGGSYNLPLLSFEPYQTIAIDIETLKNSKKPDARGMPFPANATHGQAVWFAEVPYSLVGRTEQTNLSDGIARSFSCQINCCNNFFRQACVSTAPCFPNWNSPVGNPTLTPVSGLTGTVGNHGTVTAYQYGSFCDGSTFGPSAIVASTWTTSNSSVATVSGGTVSYVSAGTANIGISSYPLVYYDWFQECICHSHTYTAPDYMTIANEQAPVTVRPLINSISPAKGLIGNTVSVTLNGNGFGTTPTVNAGSGITVTVNSSSNTQITASFAISTSAPSGNHSVTVTAGGQTSSGTNFYVQIPTKLVRQDYPGIPNGYGPLVTITNGNVVDAAGTVRLTGQCGMYRNLVYSLQDQETPSQNIDGTYTLTETFSNYTSTFGGTAPGTQNYNMTPGGLLTDIQWIGKPAPACPGNNDHEEFNQSLSVTTGGSLYNLSTVNHIARGNYSGTATVTVTITIP
jgi:hypothetical protein